MTARLDTAERAIGRVRSRECVPAVRVCDRIEELTARFAEHPPTLPPQVEAGILAAVDREIRYSAQPS